MWLRAVLYLGVLANAVILGEVPRGSATAQPEPKLEEYFHGVPSEWEEDYRRVLTRVVKLLGEFEVEIIAWPSSHEAPEHFGRTLKKGQYVSGRRDEAGKERLLMVLEISEFELEHQHAHRLSVIAHEYFHVYQRNINSSMRDDFSVKWLIEGAAAVFEAMYLKDFEQIPDYPEKAQLTHANRDDFGERMESYENPDVNYGTSVAMVLALCRETGFQRMVDFWRREPSDENWRSLFKEVFQVEVEAFYAEGRKLPFDQLRLAAMGHLNEIKF